MIENKIKDGGPAFPCEHMVVDTSLERHAMRKAMASGISVRDYFAAKATWDEVYGVLLRMGKDTLQGEAWVEAVAQARWILADAMLAAREHSNPKR